MKHYKNTEQITSTIKYQFSLPKYGKSTTDPTYYEPSATRIANMRKSAQAGKSLYDFDGSGLPTKKDKKGNDVTDWEKQDISKARITPGRKPGLTREEISQNLTYAKQDVEDMKNDKLNEIKESEKQINQVKQTLESLSSSDNESSKKSE